MVERFALPRVKPEHRPYRTVDGNIRIGSVIYGIGAEIEDPQGWIWTLIEALDGTRSPSDVIAEVRLRHPDLAPEDVPEALTDLYGAGFIEDAGAPNPLPPHERERHSRGVPLLRWMDRGPRRTPWEAQLRLREARVLLVGLGGTGGHAAQNLVASGVGHLHCVEPDTVELSNLNRQPLYRESDIGRPKLDAALATLRALNSDVEITGERREIQGPQDLADLAGGDSYGLLVVAADRPVDIWRWANRVCIAARLPWVDAGYRGPLATAGVYVPGSGACWECLREGEFARRDLRLADGQDEEIASPRMAWNPATSVTAALSGALLAHAATALLTGVPALDPGFRFGVNLMVPGDPVLERFPRLDDCPACGHLTPR
ncbi:MULTISPECIES: ThiF family adenylyltransferase [unclassified Streptomyces]|uniref:HesA/MoeB/ThiF family protein n=1 Tax=unclassified Streptomyces TaxID=2593676 RepID=UPI001EFDB070|nr:MULTISPECIES: ThiF family adenylyltransferase [unclassified Streptomyces]